jgi:hypothetical protein
MIFKIVPSGFCGEFIIIILVFEEIFSQLFCQLILKSGDSSLNENWLSTVKLNSRLVTIKRRRKNNNLIPLVN